MISGFILKNLLGWKIIGEFPNIKKSIVIFAPHTSYYDALYGKLFLNEIGINHNFLSKKELFFFPMNIVMRLFGSIPVDSLKYGNTIYEISHLIEVNKSLHIILSPEGTRKKVLKWNKDFYYMAYRAKVPIVVGYLDYKKKEIGIKGVIENLENVNTLMNQINIMYKDISAKYPEKFSLELVK
ncbi:MAG: glycerol acyltransferase [Bacteroidales bacterium]|jgi:1-acyl-sn-glycerol-3-phosphate acyltransferase|nr:glycerol acyltransferase [Bacteroidales bacterium]